MRKMKFIPFDDSTLVKVERDIAGGRAKVSSLPFPELTVPLRVLDSSDFQRFSRNDFPAGIAYTIAVLLCQRRGLRESPYWRIPPKDSFLRYPLVPARIAGRSILLDANPNVTKARQR
jgi:hypothetical protein